MSKIYKGEYLQKKKDDEPEVKEQMIYGNDKPLHEKEKLKKYKENTLNE